MALGVILATGATLLVGGTSTSALAAVGIAAGTAACMRMPFTALLLGVMLTYPAGGATTVLAIVGTIVGLATRLAGERFAPALAPPTALTRPGSCGPAGRLPARGARSPPGSATPWALWRFVRDAPGGTCVCYPSVAS